MRDRFINLKYIKRMTFNVANLIKEKHLVPVNPANPRYKCKHGIQGPSCTVEKHALHTTNIDVQLKSRMKYTLIKLILNLNNVHPGHVAVLLPDDDFNMIFTNEEQHKDYVDIVNKAIRNRFVQNPTTLSICPQVTATLPNTSDGYHHESDIKECRCKLFFCRVRNVKGLTFRVVYYLLLGTNNEMELKDNYRCRFTADSSDSDAEHYATDKRVAVSSEYANSS